MRPRLLDLYSCAGCIARGYDRAGFDVIGVDKTPQPNYPFAFFRADALAMVQDIVHGCWHEDYRMSSLSGQLGHCLGRFDAIHASPPCQRFSDLAKRNGNAHEWPDLIEPTRELLDATGLPYVIENVEGAPLIDPVMLCGSMFPETRVYRHRLFETNWPLTAPMHPAHTELTFTHDKRKAHYGRPLDLDTMRVQVTGGGNAPVWAKAQAMGLAGAGLTGRELNEGVPPVYGEHLGRQLMTHILERAA